LAKTESGESLMRFSNLFRINLVHNLFLLLIIGFLGVYQCEKEGDIEPPVVQITSPESYTEVFDITEISVRATDDNKVQNVILYIDDTKYKEIENGTNPYEFSWNTTNLEDSSIHILKASAIDNSGNTRMSDVNEYTVNNFGRPPVPVTLNIPGEIDKHSMKLTWEKSMDKDFKEYQLFRNEVGVMNNEAKLIAVITDPNITHYLDNGQNYDTTEVSPFGLLQNMTYFYQITIIDNFELEGKSEVVNGKTSYSAPVVIKEEYEVTKYSATIHWYENNEDVAYYRIHRSRRNNMGNVISDSVGYAENYQTAYTDTGLISLTSYYYRVFLVDVTGFAAGSNELNIQTKSIIPVDIRAPQSDDLGKNSIRLNWIRSQEEDEISYSLYRSLSPGVLKSDSLLFTSSDKLDTVFTDTGLDQGTDYFYTIYCKDSRNNEIKGNEIKITTLEMFSLDLYPREIKKYSATIEWEKYPYHDFDKYIIYRDTHQGFNIANADKKRELNNVNNTQFDDTDLSLLTNYYYKLGVWDIYGNAAFSDLDFQTSGVQAVEIKSIEPVEDTYFEITFSQNIMDEDFLKYTIYRDDSTDVNQDDLLLKEIFSRQDTVYEDHFNVEKGDEFFYRIYVVDSRGNTCFGSNVLGDSLDSQPNPGVLYFEEATNTTIKLRWEKNENIDFYKYVLYKSVSEAFTKDDEGAIKLTEIFDINAQNYIETGLESGQVFYYILYIYDVGGKYSESNIVCGYTNP